MDMTGKTVVITGASRGIGEAATRAFADAGANVVLLARSGDAIGRIAREIGDRALAVTCDVASWSQVKSAIDQAAWRFGKIDVLINNAGVIEPVAMLRASDPAAWSKAFDINLKGVYHGMRAVVPIMRKAGGGTVLTVSSGAAHTALEGWSHYCASKAAAHMMTMALHKEEARAGIRAIGLSPGTVATEMQREIKASGVGPVAALDWSDHIPPEWPAQALMWMCTPDADEFLGGEVSLREPEIRKRLGLGA
ncbi:SDR family oxidoreductase [Maritimibacter sp. HL-12]|uniref:SDR family oxidoreductase n=1 Tax=Maritimibacter sp. HL-12 TaxID=1162418 RepID=UPI000A0F3325|nr:SDR family oxidoreductase [Maritimibacter sp. HL-12]SMH47207.1 NADP-dependent 3-hydroxy acid dehydrogenase YdfG [Maritimibacter sp. HL-12]